jgi:hypothetical protein
VGVEIGELCMVARVERLHVRLATVMLWRNLFHSLIVGRDYPERKKEGVSISDSKKKSHPIGGRMSLRSRSVRELVANSCRGCQLSSQSGCVKSIL